MFQSTKPASVERLGRAFDVYIVTRNPITDNYVHMKANTRLLFDQFIGTNYIALRSFRSVRSRVDQVPVETIL